MAAPRDVKAEMRYERSYTGGNPYTPGVAIPPGEPLFGQLLDRKASKAEFKKFRHEMTEVHEMTLVDARTALPGGLAAWDLDTHGFCVVQPPPPVDFTQQGDPKNTT